MVVNPGKKKEEDMGAKIIHLKKIGPKCK